MKIPIVHHEILDLLSWKSRESFIRPFPQTSSSDLQQITQFLQQNHLINRSRNYVITELAWLHNHSFE